MSNGVLPILTASLDVLNPFVFDSETGHKLSSDLAIQVSVHFQKMNNIYRILGHKNQN